MQTGPRYPAFLLGVKSAVPIVIGYIPLGFAYGVLARQAGLSVMKATAMSLAVYAGSAQFIAVEMLANGGTAAAIVSTTLLVNLRHLLFSASLVPYFRRLSSLALAFLSFGITDETYAVGIGQYSSCEPQGLQVFGLHLVAYLSWVMSSFTGAAAGALIGDGSKLGLDFALPAMFIALVIPQIKNGTALFVAIISGLIAVGFALSDWSAWSVILATLISATVGVLVEQWTGRHLP
ncbi:MAG TPA: AzlC family ABC transporter permease [Firmicutes bacterium]|nr:AzlC family ABC transporter permease [Bacillota bacterium]